MTQNLQRALERYCNVVGEDERRVAREEFLLALEKFRDDSVKLALRESASRLRKLGTPTSAECADELLRYVDEWQSEPGA